MAEPHSAEAEATARPGSVVAMARFSGRARLDDSDVAWLRPLSRLAKDATLVVPAELLGQLDRNVPIDIAVASEVRLMREPRLVPVVSAGLQSVEEALAALRSAGESEVSALGNGRFRVVPDDGGECLLTRSSGPSAARLVCARQAAHVERLSGWLAEGLSAQPMPDGADLSATLYGDGVRHAFAATLLGVRAMGPALIDAELRSESPLLADLIAPLMPELMNEGLSVLDDLDEITARGTGDASSFRISLEMRMRSNHAWTSGALQDAANDRGAAPVVFWRMPKDANTAWFVGTSGGHARLEHLRGALARSSDAALSHLDPALRALITDSFIPPGTFAYASGFASERLPVDIDPQGDEGEAEWIRREVVARFGWHIAGVDEPVARYADYLAKAVDAYNRGPIRDLAYGGISALCAGMPKITKHPLRRPGFPPGTFEYEMAVPGSFFDNCGGRRPNTLPSKPLRGVIVVMPDGDGTMLGLSLDPPALYARMQQAANNPPKEIESLAGSSALSVLLEPHPFAGGFLTLSGLAMLVSNLDSASRGHYVGDHHVTDTRSRSDGGMTPIAFAWSAAGGTEPTLRALVVVPRAAVD